MRTSGHRAMLTALTPLGWLAIVVVAVSAAALVLGGSGFRWDPFDLSRRRLETARADLARARIEAEARSAEADAQGRQVARLDLALTTGRSLERATTHAVQEARTADDQHIRLSKDRADRLRHHDDELCRIAPDLVPCTPAADPADGGEPSV